MKVTVSAFMVMLLVAGCGQFLGFSDPPDPDLGDIRKIHISLSPEGVKKLYATVVEDDYVPCLYSEPGVDTQAEIHVRGFTSRGYPKKSFTVRMQQNGRRIKFAVETFSVSNRIVFDAYARVGLHVPGTEGAALYINGEYLGCYTKMGLYDQDELAEAYYGRSGQLFMGYMWSMGYDHPLRGISEKKFPDDNDFSRLETFVYNAVFMSDDAWTSWLDNNVDRDEIVRYMVVHDFFAVRDTNLTNYCIYDYGHMFLLPWDHELCMNLERFPGIGGDTPPDKAALGRPVHPLALQ